MMGTCMCVHVYARGQQASTMSREVEGVVVCHIVSHSHCVSLSLCVCVGVCVCDCVCVSLCGSGCVSLFADVSLQRTFYFRERSPECTLQPAGACRRGVVVSLLKRGKF